MVRTHWFDPGVGIEEVVHQNAPHMIVSVKEDLMRRNRVISKVILLILVVGIFVVFGRYCVPASPLPFDRHSWQHGTCETRGRMALSREFRDGLIGKTAQQVIDLLGEPAARNENPIGPSSYSLVYITCPPNEELDWMLIIRCRDDVVVQVEFRDS